MGKWLALIGHILFQTLDIFSLAALLVASPKRIWSISKRVWSLSNDKMRRNVYLLIHFTSWKKKVSTRKNIYVDRSEQHKLLFLRYTNNNRIITQKETRIPELQPIIPPMSQSRIVSRNGTEESECTETTDEITPVTCPVVQSSVFDLGEPLPDATTTQRQLPIPLLPIPAVGPSSDTTTTERQFPILACSQAQLSNACKRLGLSGSGSKSILVARLNKKYINSHSETMQLHAEYLEKGPDETGGQGRGRAPNWTKDDSARLCHVIADWRHSTIVADLYQRIQDRSELDTGRKDPFADEFKLLFNDAEFQPDIPVVCDGVTDDILIQFDVETVRFKRDGQTLKQKWTKLRSSYSVARKTFEASGQGDSDVFPSFTNGDDVLCYMHCVFHDHPSLDAVIRLLPSSAQVEAGIESSQPSKSPSSNLSRRKRRHEETDVLAAAITSLGESMNHDRPIVIQDSNASSATDAVISALDRSQKVATTVQSLMSLEQSILTQIQTIDSIPTGGMSIDYKNSLDRRLQQVQTMIEDAFKQ